MERPRGEAPWRGPVERPRGEAPWRGPVERPRGEAPWRGPVERPRGEAPWKRHYRLPRIATVMSSTFLVMHESPLTGCYVLFVFGVKEVAAMGFEIASRVRGPRDAAFGTEERCRAASGRRFRLSGLRPSRAPLSDAPTGLSAPPLQEAGLAYRRNDLSLDQTATVRREGNKPLSGRVEMDNARPGGARSGVTRRRRGTPRRSRAERPRGSSAPSIALRSPPASRRDWARARIR